MSVDPANTQIPRQQLHDMLDGLIDAAAPDGLLQPEEFWPFVAAVAQGRGITERLDAEGDEAAAEEPISPKATLLLRQVRAYHARFLQVLIWDMCGARDRPSILPAKFDDGTVQSDLGSVLQGQWGEGTPQILAIGGPFAGQEGKRTKDKQIRAMMRTKLVCAVYWHWGQHRAKRQRLTLDQVRTGLLPDLEEETWKVWVKTTNRTALERGAGSATEAAKKAGEKDDRAYIYACSPEELREIFHELRKISPGVSKKG